MRDWPTDDPEIVAAIVAGDRAGLAAAYDRYATALHTYCRTLLAEPADAADALSSLAGSAHAGRGPEGGADVWIVLPPRTASLSSPFHESARP